MQCSPFIIRSTTVVFTVAKLSLFERRFRELHRLVTRDTRHRDFPRRCACHQRSYVDDGAGYNNGWRNPRIQSQAGGHCSHAHALYHNPCPLWSNTHCINLSGSTVRDTWDGRGPLKCVILVCRGPPSVNRAALIEPPVVSTGSCPLNVSSIPSSILISSSFHITSQPSCYLPFLYSWSSNSSFSSLTWSP